MNTSAVSASARITSAPCGVRMSCAIERWPALSATKPAGVSPSASLLLARITSPPAGGEVMRASKSDAAGDTPAGFVALNAGKRSMAQDIRTPQGAEVIRALAETADVFIENFRPGVVAKYGLDYPSIQALKPDIVYCSISGYGQQGDWADRGAYD